MTTIVTTLVAVKSKWMLATKSFWAFTIAGLIALIGEFQAILPEFADVLVLPPPWPRRLALAVAVLGIVLRRISDQPARFRPSNDAVAVPKA